MSAIYPSGQSADGIVDSGGLY